MWHRTKRLSTRRPGAPLNVDRRRRLLGSGGVGRCAGTTGRSWTLPDGDAVPVQVVEDLVGGVAGELLDVRGGQADVGVGGAEERGGGPVADTTQLILFRMPNLHFS